MSADIDLDFADRNQVLALISHVPARQSNGKKHNSGIYATEIPRDVVNACAALPSETAAQRGYFKLDFLNMSVYQLIRDREHYQCLLNTEPPWQRLWQDPQWAMQLVHVGNRVDLLQSMKPDSITRMAALISIIRPGKAYLQNQPWDRVFESVWDGDSSKGYIFKRSHSISYAALVALHMNLLNQSTTVSEQ